MNLYIEPRDWWVGYYRGDTHHYVCPLPCIVIRWARHTTSVTVGDARPPVHNWWHELILFGSTYPSTRRSVTSPVSIPTWRCTRCPGWERDA